MEADYTDKAAMLGQVAERAQLREGPQGIEDVLRTIYRQQMDGAAEPLTGRGLARLVRLPVPVVTAVRRELEQAGLVEPGPHIRLSTRGLEAVQAWGWQVQATASAASVVCATCEGTGIQPKGAQWDALLAKLKSHFKDNPRVDVTLDQSHCTPETNRNRVALMYERGALAGKDVLVLGDDDSLSAGIALAGKSIGQGGRLARRVIAVDTDERVLKHLRNIALEEDVIIGLITHDLRKPLPAELDAQFDTVATDPPYTLEGLKLFLSRAVRLLKPESGRIFLSFGHRPPEEQLAVQAAIAQMGLVIEQLLPNFNQYTGAGVLAGISDMYVLGVTSETRSLIDGDYTGPLYTGQTRPTLRMYVCTDCNRQIAVGSEAGGQFATIEALKDAGCPGCGGHSFKLISRRKVDKGTEGRYGAEWHDN